MAMTQTQSPQTKTTIRVLSRAIQGVGGIWVIAGAIYLLNSVGHADQTLLITWGVGLAVLLVASIVLDMVRRW